MLFHYTGNRQPTLASRSSSLLVSHRLVSRAKSWSEALQGVQQVASHLTSQCDRMILGNKYMLSTQSFK